MYEIINEYMIKQTCHSVLQLIMKSLIMTQLHISIQDREYVLLSKSPLNVHVALRTNERCSILNCCTSPTWQKYNTARIMKGSTEIPNPLLALCADAWNLKWLKIVTKIRAVSVGFCILRTLLICVMRYIYAYVCVEYDIV
jgi:hypothetical protein